MQGRKGDTDVKDRLFNTVGEGEDGMTREDGMETAQQVASGSSMFEARQPAVFCDSLEGWGGGGGS